MDHRPITINITAGAVFKAVSILALVWFLYYIRDLVVIILTALVIASAIEPAIVALRRYKIPRTLSVIMIYLSLALLVLGLFYYFLPSLVTDLTDLLAKLPEYIDQISVWNPLKGTLIPAAAPVVETFSIGQTFSIPDFINNISAAVNTSEGFFRTVAGLFGGMLSLVLIVVLSFYLAVQEDGVAKFLKVVVPDRYEEYVLSLWTRSREKIGKWLQGQLLLGALIGILVYLGLSVFQVRNALLLAILAAVFEIIPIFGPILSAIPSALIAFADSGLTIGLLVIGLYVIINQFENHLIYPLVVKKIVGIPPIIVILALIVGFKLAGVLGMLLSVPTAAVLVELLEDVSKSKARNKVAGSA